MIIITAHWIENKILIKEKIDETVSGKHIINLDEDDFVFFPKAYVEVDIDEIPKLNAILPKYKSELLDIILAISSSDDMKLSVINDITEIVMNKYGVNLNVIYGHKLNPNSEKVRVTIFIIN